MENRFQDSIALFRQRGGTMRMSQAIKAGISRSILYAMYDELLLERLSRGLYRLTSLSSMEQPDLVTVAARIPQGVICLISALAFHELTTQIPHAIDVAIARGSAKPQIDYPPVNTYWFSHAAFTSGVERHVIDGQRVAVYSAEKAIADIFKYRNKLGLDLAIEALRNWCGRKERRIDSLLTQARICKIERVIRPYIEAMI